MRSQQEGEMRSNEPIEPIVDEGATCMWVTDPADLGGESPCFAHLLDGHLDL